MCFPPIRAVYICFYQFYEQASTKRHYKQIYKSKNHHFFAALENKRSMIDNKFRPFFPPLHLTESHSHQKRAMLGDIKQSAALFPLPRICPDFPAQRRLHREAKKKNKNAEIVLIMFTKMQYFSLHSINHQAGNDDDTAANKPANSTSSCAAPTKTALRGESMSGEQCVCFPSTFFVCFAMLDGLKQQILMGLRFRRNSGLERIENINFDHI